MNTDSFPKITAPQIVAIVGAVIGVIVAYGVDLSADQQQSIMNLVAIVAGSLLGGDAVIRASRNYRRAKEAQSNSNEGTAKTTNTLV